MGNQKNYVKAATPRGRGGGKKKAKGKGEIWGSSEKNTPCCWGVMVETRSRGGGEGNNTRLSLGYEIPRLT